MKLLSSDEVQELLALSRGETFTYDTTKTWIDLFREQVALHPDRPAVVATDGTYTYRELDEASDAVARYLIAKGLQPDTFIAIRMDRSRMFMAAALGAHKASVAYVPIDQDYPAERVEYMMEDSEAALTLNEAAVREAVASCTAGDLRVASPETLAYMIYTSGSTGKPKGVMIQHKALLNFVHFIRKEWHLTDDSRIACHSNFAFDAAVEDLYPVLTVGGAMYIVPEPARKDIGLLRQYLTDNAITGGCYTTQLGQLLGSGEPLDVDYIVLGGEKMTTTPQTTGRVLNAYGPTEFTVDSTYFEVDKTRHYDNIPIGRPLYNLMALVLDSKGNLLPKGETGELCMAGPQMAKGYWKRPELTAEKFCEVTIGTEKVRVYRTGDLVRWNDENQLEYLGRIDTQVKLRGFRIELGEIEARAAMFDGISMVAAEVWQGQTLCLYYSATKDIDKASLQAFLAETLTEYMVPTAYMQLDEMPLTPNGKINRKALPAPQIQLEDVVAPESDMEQQLFGMVADLLGTSSFGVTNNLVSLGLSSLNMMKLNVIIQSKLGRQISVATIMREPTIRKIASELSRTDTDSDIPQLTAYERRERYPLTENQRGVYIDWELNRDTTQYNIPDLYRFKEMDAERLAEAVRQTVDAHCYLKTRLVVAEDDVMQECHDDEEAVVSIETLNEEPDTAFFGQRMRPFNLFNDRLYRIEIYQAPQNVYLFADIHHIIYDGLSSDVFMQSVMEAYEGKPLQPEKVTAYDFALYEQAMKQTPVYEQAQQYFETLTASASVLSVLDSDQPDGTDSGILSIPFADEGIQSFCTANGVTVSSFMHAVFSETMSRLTREDDILYLTINNGRSASADLISCVGMFVKTLPVVRPSTDKGTTVADFVKAVHQQLQESYENDIYPYTQLVERRKIHAEAMFVYQGGIIEGDSAGGEDISIALDTAKLPIDFSVYPQGDGYKLALEYSGTRYSAADIEKMGHAFVSMAHNMARGGTLNEMALVSSNEVQELLALSRGETYTYDTTKTWIDLFKEQVALHADRPAVVDAEGTYTYRELDEASDAVARYLISKGLHPDTFIAIRMDRSRLFMAAALGAHKASVAYVPIDLEYPAERVDYMMEDSEAALTLNEAAVREAVASGTTGSLRVANPETLAYMIYTSGSTGKPKGVMIQHKALMNFVHFIRKEWYLTAESRIACHSNFAFDAAVEDLYPVLTVGGTLYIVPEPARMDIGLLRQYLSENAITGGCYTTQLGQLLGSGAPLDVDYIVLGGEKMTTTPQTTGRVLNTYGPTEFTVDSTYFEVDKTRHYDNIPIGRPLYNLMALVLDSKGNLLPKGETGELCMAGPQMAKGYWKRPELTAEKFCEVTIGTEKIKVYRTGDLVRWNDENQLEYLGRIDTQVKLRGFRIELGEIEARAAMFDGISMVAAEVWQGQTLCLYYSATKDIDKSSLQAFLAETLTEYMVPTAYMQLDEMPLTPNGKINRKALPEPQIQLEDIVTPENELEQQLFDIVAELLGTSSFGVTNNLLSLGLSSLGAMRLSVAIQNKLSGQVTVATIMREPTIRQIASELSQTGTDSDIPQLKAYERRERYPLTENQRGVYIDWELNRDTTQYNIPDLYRFKEMDAERLAEAVRQTVDAHCYLKTRLVVAEDDVMQECHDDEEAVVSIETLNEEPDTAFFGQRMRPFNLFNDRLYRIEIYQAPQNVYLFADIHHIIYDGLSSDVFMQSVMEAYEGKPLQPEKVTAYDFALYEQAMKQTPVYEQAQQYFETLTASASVLSVPDSDQPDGKDSGILSIPFAGEGIQSFCTANGVTVSSFMNAVFAETMSRLTREDDMLYLTINNGRSASADLISCVGMFVKTLPVVRPATDKDTTVADFVKAVHQQLQESYENDIYPYTQLVEHQKIHAEAIFDYQGGIREDDSAGGEGISAASDTSKLPIDFSVYPQGDGYKLTLEYSGTRYSAADIEKMGQAFVSMAHNMAQGGRLNEVALVSSDEVQELLALSRGETFTYDTTKTWIDLFREQVALHPDRPAVVATDGTYTYRELDEASDAVARYLIAKGLQPDTFIAIRMDRSRMFMAAALGAHKASVAYVPIDQDYPAERVEYMMEDSEAALTLNEAAVREAVASCTAGDLRVANPETLAYMIYTSGSTGKPKGVMIQHKALMNFVHFIRKEWYLTAESRIACHSNFAFDAAVEDLYPVLTVGGAMYIVPEPARKDIGLLRQYLTDNAITGGCYTTQLGQLLGSGEPLDVDYIVLGGEKMTTTPQTTGRVLNTYGPTEFTVDSTYFEVDKTRHYDNIPIGRPLYNLMALVLDSKGNLLPKGETGELCMAGPQMAKGYWKRPELTAEKFCEVTIGTEKVKVYRTGDLVRWNDENQLEYLGRIDTQVKLRGFRIELGEIEARAAMFDGISMVAAEVWQGQTLCLYYSATKDIDKASLQAFLAETLAGYMVPAAYMQLDEMPLTPNGKINRKALPEPELKSGTDYVAPEGHLEVMFARVFENILKVSPIGANDDFFELGGTSINAIRVVVEASKQGVNIVFNDLFQLKTPRALAAYVKQSQQQSRTIKTETVVLSNEEQKTPDAVSTVTGNPYQDYDDLLQRNTMEAIRKGSRQPIEKVLLAGSTGYLGIHILHELLQTNGGKIFCPVRCDEGEKPMDKLKTLYFYYFDDENFSVLEQRVVAFKAEMSNVDALKNFRGRELTVINCVANVKHFSSGDDIEHVNTDSVRALIDFCLHTNSRLIHISTVSIAGDRVNGVPAKDVVLTEQRFWLGQQVEDNQYVHSKFVAEDLVLDAVKNRGLNAKIMRVGNLSARQADGEFQINFNSNNFMATLRAYVALGEIPFDELDAPEEFSPIDELARAILLLAETPRECVVFHPYNNHTILQVDILDGLARAGLFVKGVERKTFESRLNYAMQNPVLVELLRPLMAYDSAAGVSIEDVDYNNGYTTQVLYRLGFKWRPIDEDYVERFAKALYGLGFFDE